MISISIRSYQNPMEETLTVSSGDNDDDEDTLTASSGDNDDDADSDDSTVQPVNPLSHIDETSQ
jgi:hypothetical protein